MGALEIVLIVGAVLIIIFIFFAIVKKIIKIAITLFIVLVILIFVLFRFGIVVLPFNLESYCGSDVRVCTNGIVINNPSGVETCYNKLGIRTISCTIGSCEASVNICK